MGRLLMHRRLVLPGILHHTLPLQCPHNQIRPLARRPAPGAGLAWRRYGPHHVPDLFKLDFHHPANVVFAVVVPRRVKSAFGVPVQAHAVTAIARHMHDCASVVNGRFEEETGVAGIPADSDDEKDFVRSHGLRRVVFLVGINRGAAGMDK